MSAKQCCGKTRLRAVRILRSLRPRPNAPRGQLVVRRIRTSVLRRHLSVRGARAEFALDVLQYVGDLYRRSASFIRADRLVHGYSIVRGCKSYRRSIRLAPPNSKLPSILKSCRRSSVCLFSTILTPFHCELLLCARTLFCGHRGYFPLPWCYCRQKGWVNPEWNATYIGTRTNLTPSQELRAAPT